MPATRKLTARQQQVLDFLRSFLSAHGYPPSQKEIAEHFGFASANAANAHLSRLHEKGAIKIHAGVARGIQILGAHSVQRETSEAMSDG